MWIPRGWQIQRWVELDVWRLSNHPDWWPPQARPLPSLSLISSSTRYESVSRSVTSNSLGPHKFPLSMGFSRPGYWRGLPCPSPGDLPNSETEPRPPALEADSLASEPPGKPHKVWGQCICLESLRRLNEILTGESPAVPITLQTPPASVPGILPWGWHPPRWMHDGGKRFHAEGLPASCVVCAPKGSPFSQLFLAKRNQSKASSRSLSPL